MAIVYFRLATPSFVLAALLLTVVRCDDDDDHYCSDVRTKHHASFSYDMRSPDGPVHWGSRCEGKRQSPVNVVPNFGKGVPNRAPEIESGLAVIRWKPAPNNFDFQCADKFGSCGAMRIGVDWFRLAQLHLHAPAEHRISGRRYPLELHFVHKGPSGRLAVVAVLFKIGPFNLQLQRMLDAASKKHYAVVELPKLLSATNSDVCLWQGSLTTPPCSEGVTWVLSLRVLTVSLRQVGEYRAMVGERTTARPLQPVNGRTVQCFPRLKASGSIPGIV